MGVTYKREPEEIRDYHRNRISAKRDRTPERVSLACWRTLLCVVAAGAACLSAAPIAELVRWLFRIIG